MIKTGTKQEAINSLFSPGGTIDIIVRKITKNTVKITYQNQNFTINKHGVLCVETVLENGKIWYSFCPAIYPKHEIIKSVEQYVRSKRQE